MSIGVSILLFVVGAILKFAVTDSIDNVDLATIGIILMIAGAVGFLVSVAWMFSRRGAAPAPPAAGYVEQRRVYQDRL